MMYLMDEIWKFQIIPFLGLKGYDVNNFSFNL